eukprot:5670436-Pyramimonas_sp.AAC.1
MFALRRGARILQQPKRNNAPKPARVPRPPANSPWRPPPSRDPERASGRPSSALARRRVLQILELSVGQIFWRHQPIGCQAINRALELGLTPLRAHNRVARRQASPT